MSELKTKRLILKPLDVSYAEQLLPVYNDWEVVKYTYHCLVNNLPEQTEIIKDIIDYYKSNELNFFPHVPFYGNEAIGMIGAMSRSKAVKEYEMWYTLGRKFWGNKFGTEVAKFLIKELFKNHNAERIYAEVVTDNIASWRILQGIGMQREGCLRRKFYNGKNYLNIFIYSILRNEWRERHD